MLGYGSSFLMLRLVSSLNAFHSVQTFSVIGFTIVTAASYSHLYCLAGILRRRVLILDGVVAGQPGKATVQAFLDSFWTGIQMHFTFSIAWYLAALAIIPVLSPAWDPLTFLISYARRGGRAGESCHTGIMERRADYH
jgi:hypothetical protein